MSAQRKRVVDDDDEEEFDETPTPKKSRATPESPSAKPVFKLGAKKKVSISEFRGTLLVDIREYYRDNNDGAEKVSSPLSMQFNLSAHLAAAREEGHLTDNGPVELT